MLSHWFVVVKILGRCHISNLCNGSGFTYRMDWRRIQRALKDANYLQVEPSGSGAFTFISSNIYATFSWNISIFSTGLRALPGSCFLKRSKKALELFFRVISSKPEREISAFKHLSLSSTADIISRPWQPAGIVHVQDWDSF